MTWCSFNYQVTYNCLRHVAILIRDQSLRVCQIVSVTIMSHSGSSDGGGIFSHTTNRPSWWYRILWVIYVVYFVIAFLGFGFHNVRSAVIEGAGGPKGVIGINDNSGSGLWNLKSTFPLSAMYNMVYWLAIGVRSIWGIGIIKHRLDWEWRSLLLSLFNLFSLFSIIFSFFLLLFCTRFRD